ncbi:MAG: hypothetical protein SXA11_00230 [Cyanobacteriota bacterium]|nr:hypothetical protein [Cyanobacteriota bacterium]
MDAKPNSSSVSTTESRFVLDRLLEQLLLEARQYPRQSTERQAAMTRLWNAMMPSNSKRRSLLPTDLDAKNRLGRTKSSLRNKYGEELKNAFEDCWFDNLQAAQLELVLKIDIYNLGVDYLLFKHWQHFFDRVSKRDPRNNEKLQQDYRRFNQKVEQFSRRFVKRQQKNRRLSDEGAIAIAGICQHFSHRCCQAVSNPQTDIQPFWDDFCRELQQYYTPKSVWNWFEYILRNRFENSVRERKKRCCKEISGDAPFGYNVDSGDRFLTLFETLPSPDSLEEIETNLPKPKELVDLLVENPHGIFSSKHLKGYPDITFREIAISKTQDLSWDAIEAKFGKRASGTRTISPFYSRNKKYFEPIIKDYLAGSFSLPPETLSKIEKDSDRRFAKRKMKQHQEVNFQDLVGRKATGETWEKVAADFGITDIKSLIVFYLDALSAFKLAPQEKKQKSS